MEKQKIIRNPRIATHVAKRRYPRKPSKSLGPFVELQWLMVKSRRTKGLTDEEVQQYISIIELNIEEISKWHERWLCSIFDTLGENGHPIFLVLSTIRMMEKLNKPTKKKKNDFIRASALRPDIHKNLARRISKNLGDRRSEIPLIYSLMEQINKDADSILGRFTALSGISISKQMARLIKK